MPAAGGRSGAKLLRCPRPPRLSQALVDAGIVHRVHEFDHERGVTGFGDEAVDSLGLDPARVLKTLVVTADEAPAGQLFVGLVPVEATLDPKAMGAAVGCKRVHLADVAVAERSSGYVVGAISPIGQKRRAADGRRRAPRSPGRRSTAVPDAAASSWSSPRPTWSRVTGATVSGIARQSSAGTGQAIETLASR